MKVAAVDIGTNTVRLLIADLVPDGDTYLFRDSERHEIITRLGEGLDASGRLSEAPMERALTGLGHYRGLIDAFGAETSAAVATAATRSAENGLEFIDRVAAVLGFHPRVIDGVEEARLTFAGATHMLRDIQSFCVIDVGGGSTEFVVGETLPDYALSVDVGSVRLTERIASLGLKRPAAMRDYVDELFAGVVLPHEPALVLGSGGTFVTLGAVHQELYPTTGSAEPERMSFDELQLVTDRLLDMNVPEIAQLDSVTAGRAGVLQAGAICAERAVHHIGSDEVRVSISDILDGLALEIAVPST